MKVHWMFLEYKRSSQFVPRWVFLRSSIVCIIMLILRFLRFFSLFPQIYNNFVFFEDTGAKHLVLLKTLSLECFMQYGVKIKGSLKNIFLSSQNTHSIVYR